MPCWKTPLDCDIGIPGNEKADALACLLSHLGELRSSPGIFTEEGIRSASRQARASLRSAPGFGVRRTDWHKAALAAYTWARTDRGPQKSWLHHIQKIDDPSCPCGAPLQNGFHLTFSCPLFHRSRINLLGDAQFWEELDKPIWRKSSSKEDEIFGILHAHLSPHPAH